MGSRGPARTPTGTLRKRGSWLAAVRDGEPSVPILSDLAPPKEISCDPVAAAKWAELVPVLAAARILGECDRDALADYCRVWSRREQASGFLGLNGPHYIVYGGIDAKTGERKVKTIKPYPQVWEEMKYTEMLRALRARLGIDPASRSNVDPVEDGEGEATDKGRFFRPPAEAV